ncbi:MAG: InlB B-repeat-containing protein, partial [Clostridiales bacterium]|nr:InlB B-repeat-containing protein [Clostridiales bacterium]
ATALGRIDDAGRAVADVFGVAEGSTTVTYTVGDEKEVWKITVTAAPAKETPAEEEPADVTYSVSRYLEEKASEGSEVPFTYTQIDTISVTGKPGAEVTLPAVSGAIAVDTDADYIFPYEDGTAALTLPAQTPEDLSLSVFYVKTEALPEINDFNLEVPDSTPYRTYYFYNVETGGEPVEAWTQIVTNGDTLRLPAAPAKENAKFTGWYANGTRIGDSYEQVTIDNVTEDKDIIVRPRFEDVGYVFFLDKKGAVCHTAEGKPGEEMADNEFALAKAAASGSLEPDDSILSWKNGDAEVTSVTFEAGSITLSPDVKKGFWVTFDVDGGEYMAPVFREAGTTLTPETPVKPGYVFEGWYMDGVADPVTSVSDTANLTAHWSASSETNYTVIHWLENADDTNYTYFRSEVKQGTTGALTEAAAIPSGDSEFEDRDYYEVQDITQQTIAGDGSTIVNVYYNRRTYTVTYKDVPVKCDIPEHKHSVDGGCYELTCTNTDWWHSHSVWWGCYELTCTQQEHTHGNACQIGSKTVTAKWGANIAHTWPGGNFIVQSTGKHQASIDVMPKYNETFTLDTAVPDENAKDVSSAGYWLQKIESNNKDDFANGYTKDHVDRISGTDWSISAEDSYPITGFTFYKYVTKSGEGKAYNGAKFYYTRNTYNITLLYKDGTNVQNPISYKYEQTVNPLPTDLTAPAGTPKGYKFAGWFADPEGTQKFELPKTMPARGLTAYAVWKAEPVNATVHFSVTMNGETRTLTVPYGSTLAEAPGYNEMLVDLAKANGNKKPVAWCTEDGTLFDVNTKLYSPVTLKPMFAGDADAYTVTYKEDGKDPIQDTQTYKSGSYAKAKEPEVLLDSNGNYFSGWTDDNDNTYQPGEAIEIAGNVTLTAVYKAPPARTYIVYHSNFGTDAKYSVGPYMVNAKVPPLAAYPTDKLPDHEKDGYKFVGWSLTPGGSEAIDQVVIKGNEHNDLYAIWVKAEFNITYRYTGDVVPNDAPPIPKDTKGTVNDTIKVAAAPSVPGYTFSGWTTTTADVTVADDGTFIMPASDVAFTGTWTIRDDLGYTVKYYKDSVAEGNLLNTDTGTGTYGDSIPYTDGKYLPTGYVTPGTVSGQETITEVADNNVLNVVYSKNANLGYTVKYYKDSVAEGNLLNTDTGTGTYGDSIPYTDGKYLPTGYVTPGTVSGQETITEVADNNVLNVVYSKNSNLTYTVNYYWMGTTTKVADSKTVDEQTFDEEVTESAIDVTGYTKVNTEAYPASVTFHVTDPGNVINFYYYKNVELTANSGVRVYNGETQTITGYDAHIGTDKLDLTFDGVTASGSGKDVSATPYEVAFSADPVGTVDTSSKYIVTAANPGTLTIVRQSINPTDPPILDPDDIDPDQSYYIGITVEDPADVMYNGKSQKGLPVVKDSKDNELKLGKDYTLSYSDDTRNVGTVTVTITGIGNYQGEFIHLEGSGDGLYRRPVTYKITPRRVVLKSESATKVYDGTALTRPNVAVSGDGFVAGEVTGLKATGSVTNVTETPVINTITYTTGADFKATNYIIEKAEGELSITKAEVGVVTVSGLRDTYWWTGAEREVTGFIHDGEDRLITVTIKDKDKAVARGTEVGRYYMGLKETDFTAESPNYYKVVVKVEDGYLDIVPINITVTVTVRGNRDTVTFDGNPHTVEGYEVVSAIANTGRDMGMDGITLKFKGDASVTGTEVGTYDMGLKASDFTVECDIYRVVRVVVEDGQLEITPAPEEVLPEEPTEEIPDETVPLAPPEEIPDEPVPQAGPAWALVNLILSILTVLASLLLLVGYFGKKEEEAEDENGNAILDAEGNNVMNDIKKRGGWRLASLVPAILSVIAFLLTENMRNPMILVDRWTLLMVIIAVVQVLVMLLSKKKTEDNTQEA